MAALPLPPAACFLSSSRSASCVLRSTVAPFRSAAPIASSSASLFPSTRQCGSLTLQLESPSFTVSGKRKNVAARASENEGSDPSSPSSTDAGKESSASLEGLPLESKLQMKLEQKLKMKLAKKLRLRRKRLVRKRQLRKKGRWPPSKMKKNKNV